MNNDSFVLRRVIDPYVGYIVIFSCILFFCIYITILGQQDWKTLVGLMLIILFSLAVLIQPNLCYRVFWRDGVIVQKASGMKDVSIRVEEITQIAQETSDVQTMLSLTRPLRRIAIYAEKRHEDGKFIDVSLKHFAADDVRRLMREIKARRPDLDMPKQWI